MVSWWVFALFHFLQIWTNALTKTTHSLTAQQLKLFTRLHGFGCLHSSCTPARNQRPTNTYIAYSHINTDSILSRMVFRVTRRGTLINVERDTGQGNWGTQTRSQPLPWCVCCQHDHHHTTYRFRTDWGCSVTRDRAQLIRRRAKRSRS